ncbi:MAG: hypothetical protein PWQ62_293 [Candidatus Methanomethylophilaceae archaeon]|nr:hypothetical protein [Candidatus Methanomethylophilaceae archaeon]
MYILITPVKNEEEYLPKVAESVIGQTIAPALWVIVDDGSIDNTPKIIRSLMEEHDWIETIQLPTHSRDLIFHISYVYGVGFDYAIQLCKNKDIQFDFIGVLDADTVIEDTYFEKLLNQFGANEKLGIASGHIIDSPTKEFSWVGLENDIQDGPLPRGSGRLMRNECFLEVGGYPIEPSVDSISNVKAKLRGWETKQFGHIRATQLRSTSSAQGLWKGYRVNGSMAHYLNKHPLLVLLGSLSYSIKEPYYTGVAYLCGYILEWLKRSPRIDDSEIRDYYWSKRLTEYLKRT